MAVAAQDYDRTIELEGLELGLFNAGKPDEFGQTGANPKTIDDLGRLRSFLNSVSDYSRSSPDPPSIMCEGQGSSDNVKTKSKAAGSSLDQTEVELPDRAAVFR